MSTIAHTLPLIVRLPPAMLSLRSPCMSLSQSMRFITSHSTLSITINLLGTRRQRQSLKCIITLLGRRNHVRVVVEHPGWRRYREASVSVNEVAECYTRKPRSRSSAGISLGCKFYVVLLFLVFADGAAF